MDHPALQYHLAIGEERVVTDPGGHPEVSEVEGQVGADLIVDHRGVGGRLLQIDGDGQRLVVHLNRLGGIGTLIGVLGDDDGHALAHKADRVGGQDRAIQHRLGEQRYHPGEHSRTVEICRGVDADHAGHANRR